MYPTSLSQTDNLEWHILYIFTGIREQKPIQELRYLKNNLKVVALS